MNKKRFVTVKDIENQEHYIIDCKDTLTAFKIQQHFYKIGEHKYSQIRFRSTIAPKKLGYKWLSLENILKNY